MRGPRSRRPLLLQAAWLVAAIGLTAAGVALHLNYYLIATSVLLLALAQFALSFERRKPQAREIVLIAVMCAVAVASRIAFIWVPHFKPVAAMVMIGGLAFGSRAGFLIGTMSMLVSNFFFGQGPWTPWQMCAFGAVGFIAGMLGEAKAFPRWNLGRKRLFALASLGFGLVVIVEGPILDTSTVLLMSSALSPESVLVIYLAGLPVNAIQGASTFVTLLLFANPLLAKLHRVVSRYGMLP